MSGSERWRTRIYLGAVFLLALALRLWWVRHFVVPNYPDQPSLEAYAANVAHGLYYGTHGAYWPPAFIFLAGLVERLAGTAQHFLAVREVNALLGALAAVLAADLARRLLRSPAAALAAGVLLALYAPSIYYTDTFLNTTLDQLMLVAVLDAQAAWADHPSVAGLALNGLLLGLATLTKPILLPLVVPGLVHWGLAGRGRRPWRAAAFASATVLLLALAVNVPWTVRNLKVTGSPVFVDVNGGVNFLIAHNPAATGAWINLGSANPVLLRGSGYDRPNTNRYALTAGLDYFLAHPRTDLRQAETILKRFWTEPDTDVSTFGANLAPLRAAWHVPLLGFGFLRDLALLGVPFLLVRWRRTLLLPLVAAGYSAGLALLFFVPRFRLPLAPVLVVTAAAGLVGLARGWLRDWRGARSEREPKRSGSPPAVQRESA